MEAVSGLCKAPPERQEVFNVRYSTVFETMFHSELGVYRTYGIQVQTETDTEILHDVTVCKKTAEHIVTLFNRHQLSPIHLRDAVMDMLP